MEKHHPSLLERICLTSYMTMCIVMSMNIYINKDNEKRLRGLDTMSMSGLINALLGEHFVTPDTEEKIIKRTIQQHVAYEGGNFCKHGYDPSLCKHAKNGKPCK